MRLQVENLVVQIGGSRIVDSVTFDAQPGSVLGLLGPNGSGKTTTLRAIYRAAAPASGTITIDGHDVWRTPPQKVAQSVAAMTQGHPVEFDFSVREIIRLGRLPHKRFLERASQRDDDIVAHSAALAHVTHLLNRMFSTLSGGERQRVLLARALTQQPRLLVLDEPTNHLDIGGQLDLLELIRTTGITVVAALHDLNLAAAICDSIVILERGKIAAAGAPSRVLTPQLLADVYGVNARCLTHPLTGKTLIAFDTLRTSSPPQAMHDTTPLMGAPATAIPGTQGAYDTPEITHPTKQGT